MVKQIEKKAFEIDDLRNQKPKEVVQKNTNCMKELFEIVVRNLSVCNLNSSTVISDDDLENIMNKDEPFIIEKFT